MYLVYLDRGPFAHGGGVDGVRCGLGGLVHIAEMDLSMPFVLLLTGSGSKDHMIAWRTEGTIR